MPDLWGEPARVQFRVATGIAPSVQALAQAQWREAQHALLLPIPYFHLVFTLASCPQCGAPLESAPAL